MARPHKRSVSTCKKRHPEVQQAHSNSDPPHALVLSKHAL